MGRVKDYVNTSHVFWDMMSCRLVNSKLVSENPAASILKILHFLDPTENVGRKLFRNVGSY